MDNYTLSISTSVSSVTDDYLEYCIVQMLMVQITDESTKLGNLTGRNLTIFC